MSWRYVMSGPDKEETKDYVPHATLVQEADEWLGPDRTFEDLEPWEQRALLVEIEAEMLQLRIQTVFEAENPDRQY